MYRRMEEQDENPFDPQKLMDAVVKNRLDGWIGALEDAERHAFLRSDAPTGLKCAVLAYMKASAKEKSALWGQAVYALFGTPEALRASAEAHSVTAWRSSTLARLQLPAERFSDRDTDILLAALLREMMLRDGRCSRLFCEYIEGMQQRRNHER